MKKEEKKSLVHDHQDVACISHSIRPHGTREVILDVILGETHEGDGGLEVGDSFLDLGRKIFLLLEDGGVVVFGLHCGFGGRKTPLLLLVHFNDSRSEREQGKKVREKKEEKKQDKKRTAGL